MSQTLRNIQSEQYDMRDSQPENNFAPVPRMHPREQSSAANFIKRTDGKPVPHFLSKTTLHRDKLFRALYGISLIVNVAYFALRIAYIVTGRVKVQAPPDATDAMLARIERQNSAAVVYSIIVLVAEVGGFILVHIGQQMFIKQKTQFAKMTPGNVTRMAQVRHLLHHHCRLPAVPVYTSVQNYSTIFAPTHAVHTWRRSTRLTTNG